MMRAMRRAAASVALMLSAAIALGGPAVSTPETKRVEIVASRFSFNPSSVTLKKGESVVLVLKSNDVPHGLRFRDLGVDVKAPPSGSAEVRFTPDKMGDFVGHCSVFCGVGHGGMTMTLHVVD